MKIESYKINNINIAEVISDDIIIIHVQDALELLGNLYYQNFERIIIHEKSITPDFFDLKTGIAGEILQKFSNYRVRLAIVGDFTKFKSRSLTDFIFESNKGKQVNFVNSVQEAVNLLSR